jgi:hypothetical protein
MAQTDDFSLECQICGFKLDGDSGVIRNIAKMKAAQDKYLERAWKFFWIGCSSREIASLDHFHSVDAKVLLDRIRKIYQ